MMFVAAHGDDARRVSGIAAGARGDDSGLLVPILALLTAALSLAEARAIADQRNGGLQAAKAAVAASRAAIEAAAQLPNPAVAATYGPDDPRVTAALDVKLPILGQRGAAIGSAEAAAQVIQMEVQTQRGRLHAAVRRSYYAFWAASAQVEVASETARVAAELARLTGERYRTGGAPRLEVEQSTLAMRRAGQDREDRAAEARAANSELSATLGVQVEAVEAPPPSDVPPEEDLLSRAVKHPEVQTFHAQEAAALAKANEERTAIRPLPTVSLTAERVTSGTPYWGLRTGIAFDVPLLSWNRGRIHEQEANARTASVQAQAAVQRLTGQIRAARARWTAASARARFYRNEFIGSATRVLEMAREGYRIGRTSLVAVLQSQSELSAARSRAIDAELETQRAVADLEEAAGADL
jgi:cobalt-zinc-cadmium efflux system outer membrane protein